jgi:hypothetical protein
MEKIKPTNELTTRKGRQPADRQLRLEKTVIRTLNGSELRLVGGGWCGFPHPSGVCFLTFQVTGRA